MSRPYRLQPVSTFPTSRLQLSPAGEEFTARLEPELEWRPLIVSDPCPRLLRDLRVIVRRIPGTPGMYVLVFDVPRTGVVRQLLVRDDVTDLPAFFATLELALHRAVHAELRGLQT